MNKFFPATLVLFVIFSTNCFSQNKPINLKFNLPKGSGYDYNMNVNSATKINAGGQDISVNNLMGVGYHFNVIADSTNWKKIASTISKISLNINTPGVNVNYDSDKPTDTSDVASATLGKVLGAMKGSEFMFTMNEKGDIGSVNGVNEMMTRVLAANPEESGGMAGSLAQSFSEENFKQNLKQAFGMYPGKPVKPGDSWTSTTSSGSSGVNMEIENTYTLESVENNIANVKVLSTIAADSSATVNIKGGTINGLMKFDVPTGIPLDGDLDMIINMSVNQGGQEMPMSINVKMKVTGQKS